MLNLDDLRYQIDKIDRQFVELLAKRFEITQQVGEYKKEQNLPPVDKSREKLQFEKIQKLAKEYNLDPEIAASMLRLIIDRVVQNHQKIRNE